MPEGDGGNNTGASSRHAGVAIDPGHGLGFGQLNPINRKIIQIDRYNSDTSDFFTSTKRAATERYVSDGLAKRGSFKGIVLRVEPFSEDPLQDLPPSLRAYYAIDPAERNNSGPPPKLLRIKARIPELHAALPLPKILGSADGPSQEIIDLYPTYTAIKPTAQFEQPPGPGDIVFLDYEDKQNWDGPLYIGSLEELSLGAGFFDEGMSPLQRMAALLGCNPLAAETATGQGLASGGGFGGGAALAAVQQSQAWGSRDKEDVYVMVLHTTEGWPSEDSDPNSAVESWIGKATREREYNPGAHHADASGYTTDAVSTHFVIMLDGTIVGLFEDPFVINAWHAGPGNKGFIGIDFEGFSNNDPNGNETDGITMAQVQAIKDLSDSTEFSNMPVCGHRHLSTSRSDPGKPGKNGHKHVWPYLASKGRVLPWATTNDADIRAGICSERGCEGEPNGSTNSDTRNALKELFDSNIASARGPSYKSLPNYVHKADEFLNGVQARIAANVAAARNAGPPTLTNPTPDTEGEGDTAPATGEGDPVASPPADDPSTETTTSPTPDTTSEQEIPTPVLPSGASSVFDITYQPISEGETFEFEVLTAGGTEGVTDVIYYFPGWENSANKLRERLVTWPKNALTIALNVGDTGRDGPDYDDDHQVAELLAVFDSLATSTTLPPSTSRMILSAIEHNVRRTLLAEVNSQNADRGPDDPDYITPFDPNIQTTRRYLVVHSYGGYLFKEMFERGMFPADGSVFNGIGFLDSMYGSWRDETLELAQAVNGWRTAQAASGGGMVLAAVNEQSTSPEEAQEEFHAPFQAAGGISWQTNTSHGNIPKEWGPQVITALFNGTAGTLPPDLATTTGPASSGVAPGTTAAAGVGSQTPFATVEQQCDVIFRALGSFAAGGAGAAGTGQLGAGRTYVAPTFTPPPSSARATQLIAAAEHEWQQSITQPPRGSSRATSGHRKVAEYLNRPEATFNTWERITDYYNDTNNAWHLRGSDQHPEAPGPLFWAHDQSQWCGMFVGFVFVQVGLYIKFAQVCMPSTSRPFSKNNWTSAWEDRFPDAETRPAWAQAEIDAINANNSPLTFGMRGSGQDYEWNSLNGRVIQPIDPTTGQSNLRPGDFVTVGPKVVTSGDGATRKTRYGAHVTIATEVTPDGVFTLEGNGGGWIYGMPPTTPYQEHNDQRARWEAFTHTPPAEGSGEDPPEEEHKRGYSGVIRGFHPWDGEGRTYIVKAGIRPLPQDYDDFVGSSTPTSTTPDEDPSE